MKKKCKVTFWAGVCLLVAFVLWTVLVCFVDVDAIGPEGTSVGFSALNGYVHGLMGVDFSLYVVTDWLGLVPIGVALGFAVLGLVQWIKRKKLFAIDKSILLLGVYYVIVIAVYIFFEVEVINHRPVLIDGRLEASYPSSTTMLTVCVMSTAMMQLCDRIKSRIARLCILTPTCAFTAFMIIGRIISGVHWITDIIAGLLFGVGIAMIYWSVSYFDNSACKKTKEGRGS